LKAPAQERGDERTWADADRCDQELWPDRDYSWREPDRCRRRRNERYKQQQSHFHSGVYLIANPLRRSRNPPEPNCGAGWHPASRMVFGSAGEIGHAHLFGHRRAHPFSGIPPLEAEHLEESTRSPDRLRRTSRRCALPEPPDAVYSSPTSGDCALRYCSDTARS